MLKSECGLQRLSKKVVKWYDETGGNGKELESRFTGMDSRMFLHNFMYLINLLEPSAKSKQGRLVLHIHAYLCLSLRDAVSLFSRIIITDADVLKLEKHCRHFYRGYCLYFHVNPTIWSLGNVVPEHTKQIKAKYGLGLGLNSMEGREAKHISIAKFCANTAYCHRWDQVFRHEFISLIWLREQGISSNCTKHTAKSYIPKRVSNSNPEYCTCGLNKTHSENFCRFCGDPYRQMIIRSIEKCKPVKV